MMNELTREFLNNLCETLEFQIPEGTQHVGEKLAADLLLAYASDLGLDVEETKRGVEVSFKDSQNPSGMLEVLRIVETDYSDYPSKLDGFGKRQFTKNSKKEVQTTKKLK